MSHKYSEITQKMMRVKPWLKAATSRLPGIQPLDLRDWVWVDDAFSRQMLYREYLMNNQTNAVLAMRKEANAAVDELLEMLVAHLKTVDGYLVSSKGVMRPDGVLVPLDKWPAIETIGRLGQQDFCVLTKQCDEHVLQAAALCFPASWRLDEKIGRPMVAIHEPVDNYSVVMAKKVQKMFDLMRPEQPLWRANCLIYSDPDLFQPRREDIKRQLTGTKRWVRVERQTLRKLPQSGAIVFGIHSFVVPEERMSGEDRAHLNLG
jgi:hypothetical protein